MWNSKFSIHISIASYDIKSQWDFKDTLDMIFTLIIWNIITDYLLNCFLDFSWHLSRGSFFFVILLGEPVIANASRRLTGKTRQLHMSSVGLSNTPMLGWTFLNITTHQAKWVNFLQESFITKYQHYRTYI